jgi:hypothetical protein
MERKITQELLQEVLTYIASAPTGNMPAGKAYEIMNKLQQLPEIKEEIKEEK